MPRCVRNSDEDLRRLEREAATGDPSAEVRLAWARERTDGAVSVVRAWIEERLEEANAAGDGPKTAWGPRKYGVLGSGLVRDVVFQHEVRERGGRPHWGLPLRAWDRGYIDGPVQVMEELRTDHLDITYVLAVQDEGSVVLAIKAAPGWTLHGSDTAAGRDRYIDGPRLDKAWPSLDRAMWEERLLADMDPEDERRPYRISAANSIWRSWCHADDARPTWGGRGKPQVGVRVRVSDSYGVSSGREGVVVRPRDIPVDGRNVPQVGGGHYHPVDWRKETPVRYDDGRLDVLPTRHLAPVPEPHDRIRIPLAVVERWRLIERGENPVASNPPRKMRLNEGATIPVRICPVADEVHRTSKRAYAHVFCGPGSTICVSSAFFDDLPREHRDGILAHELGHLFAGSEGDEPAADRAFLENTGVEILYKDSRHGRCLQCLSPDDSRKLEGRFVFDFAGRTTGIRTENDETEIEYVVSIRSDRPLDWDELLEAVGLDPALFSEPSQRGVGRRFDWTVSSLADAEEQAEAVRQILPSGMEVVAFAREHDSEGVRELGWSA